MSKRLPIHDKLDTALETVRACLRELPGDHELSIGKGKKITLWQMDHLTSSGSAVSGVKTVASFVKFMNQEAV